MRADWFPNWSRDVGAVVASGASATRADVAKLWGRCRVIVVNNGHELAPWADALYAADGKWWAAYPTWRSFAGLKITADADAANRYGLHRVAVIDERSPEAHRISVKVPGLVGHGGNSGFQAVNIAVQFGAKRILLIGFDLCGEHWHEKHAEPLKNPRPQVLPKWRVRLDAQAEVLADLGVEVVNCSRVSTLTAYRKMSVDAALAHFGLMDDTAKVA